MEGFLPLGRKPSAYFGLDVFYNLLLLIFTCCVLLIE